MVFIDAMVVKIRDGQVTNRPIYTAIGVTIDGRREILGLWAGTGGEGAKFWLQVLTEIKNRGTEDVCMLVCDGLKGLPDAIDATWPLAIVQTCVLHLIRNTFRLASRRDWDAMARELRPVYTAPTETAAKERLSEFHAAWGETYPAIKGLWDNAWAEFVPFLDYSPEIRRVIYSTNAIESLNARMRRATRARGHFPVDLPRPRPSGQHLLVSVGRASDVEVAGAVGHGRGEQPVDRGLGALRPGWGMRPWLGLNPTRPQNPARMRVEPPPSLAVAAGTRPAATAAALPPLDPPAVRPVSHGLRAVPNTLVRVRVSVPNSGAAVLPIGTAPAARRRATWIESAATSPRPAKASEPWDVGLPAQSSRSFTPIGTPANGPGSRPAATAASTASAAACASPSSTWTNAPRRSLPAAAADSVRARTSTAFRSLVRTDSAISMTVSRMRSPLHRSGRSWRWSMGRASEATTAAAPLSGPSVVGRGRCVALGKLAVVRAPLGGNVDDHRGHGHGQDGAECAEQGAARDEGP